MSKLTMKYAIINSCHVSIFDDYHDVRSNYDNKQFISFMSFVLI